MKELLNQIINGLTHVGTLIALILGILKVREYMIAGPKIKGHIEQASIIHGFDRESGTDKKPFCAEALIDTSVVNTRPHPSTLRVWRVTLRYRLRRYHAQHRDLPREFAGTSLHGMPKLHEITFATPLTYGVQQRGCLYFKINGIGVEAQRATLTLRAVDAFGRSHFIGRSKPKDRYPLDSEHLLGWIFRSGSPTQD